MIKPDKIIFYILLIISYGIPYIGIAQNNSNAGSYSGNQEKELKQYVHSLLHQVEQDGRTVDVLATEDLLNLPVGIVNQKAGSRQILAIDTTETKNGEWFFNIYASITIPGTTKPLIFAGKNISLSASISGSSVARMELISEHRIDISADVELVLPGNGRNYISFDCNGFRALHLQGNFEFNPQKILPDPDLAKGQTKVTATFETDIVDLNNILISTSITPFQVRGIDGFSFEVRNATLDMSDFANPEGFSFPLEYQEIYQEDIYLWRGFYMEEMNIYMPKEFKNRENKNSNKVGRVQVQAKDFLLDELGVSGKFSVKNLLDLKQGDIGSWDVSIAAARSRADSK